MSHRSRHGHFNHDFHELRDVVEHGMSWQAPARVTGELYSGGQRVGGFVYFVAIDVMRFDYEPEPGAHKAYHAYAVRTLLKTINRHAS